MDLLATVFGMPLVQVAVALALFVGAYLLLNLYYAKRPEMRTRQQLLQGVLLIVALVTLLALAPIGDARRGQLLSLLGILLSAAIALSSTTVLGNAMAGLMLRSIKAFRPGDYLRIGEHFGRVTETDLLHVEMQTESSDLTTLSNVYMITHPYQVIRSTGTIMSVEVSLGYDVPRHRVEELLLAAATEAGLEEPFVQILELGDFSVSYRVAGQLKEVKALIAARSRLRAKTLDSLHAGGIEIVSPNFMNTRSVEGQRIIPAAPEQAEPEREEKGPEAVIFDKAEEAESVEELRARHEKLLERIEAAREQLKTAGEPEAEALNKQIAGDVEKAERLAALVQRQEEKLKAEE